MPPSKLRSKYTRNMVNKGETFFALATTLAALFEGRSSCVADGHTEMAAAKRRGDSKCESTKRGKCNAHTNPHLRYQG